MAKKTRLNCDVPTDDYQKAKRTFSDLGISLAEATRTALNLLVDLLQVIKDGGEVIVRDADGGKRMLLFPMLNRRGFLLVKTTDSQSRD